MKQKNLNLIDPYEEKIKEIIFKIIKTRKSKKITQQKLAEVTGLPQTTISRMECFKVVPTLNLLIKICDALDLKILVIRIK